MKIYETRPGAGFNVLPQVRVRSIPDGAKLPDGASAVDDDTPAFDWTEAHAGFTPPAPKATEAPTPTDTEEAR